MNKGELGKWLAENELKSYCFINQAKVIKRNYYMGVNLSRIEEERAIKSMIREQMKTYTVEDTVHFIMAV
jgi:hypothetical protein